MSYSLFDAQAREVFKEKTFIRWSSLDPVVLPWSENWTVPVLVRRESVTGSVLPGGFSPTSLGDFAGHRVRILRNSRTGGVRLLDGHDQAQGIDEKYGFVRRQI